MYIFNISIEVNVVDLDQTAPDLGPHCLSMGLQIFQWTTKYIHFVIMHFKGK